MRLLGILLLLVVTTAAIKEEEIPEPDILPDPETTENANAGEELVEGDMDLGQSSEEGSDRNMLNGDWRRWPKNAKGFVRVPYVFKSDLPAKGKEMIQAAIKDYRRWTCVQFIPRKTQKDYIEIYRGTSGCSATVGKVGGRQNLKLSDNCYPTKGTPSHEMMHALGFKHEQSRSDRDKYVKIVFDNIDKSHSHNFDLCDDTKCTLPNFAYDYDSVLHYSSTSFSTNRKETIIPVGNSKGVEIGKRNGLSALDIKKVNQMYDCGSKTSESNKGLTIPQDELNDHHLWPSCPKYVRYCGNPTSDFKYLKYCKKSCNGATKNSKYDKYNNCDSLAKDASYCKKYPTNCAYSCNGHKW